MDSDQLIRGGRTRSCDVLFNCSQWTLKYRLCTHTV